MEEIPKPNGPVPHKPTIDEIVANTVASMEIEGQKLTPEEIAVVRARAVERFANRLSQGDKQSNA